MSYKLIEATDKHMTRKRFSLPRGQHLYPSEGSIKYIDHRGIERVEGKCLRQAWYRITGTGTPTETTPYTQWIFALGRAVEDILTEEWKQMGIWVANNVRFYDSERNISGEVDVILKDPKTDKLFCGEVKSFYGYQATKDICGNTKVVGKPKTSQLIQSLIYVHIGNKLGLFNYVKMVYYARDSAARAEFDITLTEIDNVLRPTIDGIIDYRFTMQDIYNRYIELTGYVEQNILPPRDYIQVYSPKEVEIRKTAGDISKTAYVNYKRNPTKYPCGHWMCRFCQMKNQCSSEDS